MTVAPTSTVTRSRTRIDGLDLVRGLAILLMVLDHVLVLVDPDHLARLTITRLALPAFAITTGYLWRPRWSTRYLQLLVAAIAADVASGFIGPEMGQPGILWLIVYGYGLLWLFEQLDWPPVLKVTMAVLAWHWLPVGGMPDWWTGYHPFEVVAWMLLGRHMLSRHQVAGLPRIRWAEAIGRRPLTWYVAHLAVLASLATLGTPTSPPDAIVMAPASLSGAGGVGARQGDPRPAPDRFLRTGAACLTGQPVGPLPITQVTATSQRPKGRGSVHLGTRTATLEKSGPRVHIARAADTDSRLGRHSRCHRTQAYLTPRA